jgi:hypothetical protein
MEVVGKQNCLQQQILLILLLFCNQYFKFSIKEAIKTLVSNILNHCLISQNDFVIEVDKIDGVSCEVRDVEFLDIENQ